MADGKKFTKADEILAQEMLRHSDIAEVRALLQKKIMLQMAVLILSVLITVVSSAAFMTRAWFASNKEVDADDSTVTMQSNTILLQIRNADGESSNTEKTQASAKNTNAVLYPAHWKTADTWQYGYSDSASAAALNSTGYIDVAAADTDAYRLKNTFHLWMYDDPGNSENVTTYNLVTDTCKVTYTGSESDNFLDAVSIVILYGDKVQQISAHGQTSGTEWTISDPTVLAASVDETGLDVTVCIYVDGDNSIITTNNAAAFDLAGLKVDLSFKTSQTAS